MAAITSVGSRVGDDAPEVDHVQWIHAKHEADDLLGGLFAVARCEIRKAVEVDCLNGPCDSCRANADAFIDKLAAAVRRSAV